MRMVAPVHLVSFCLFANILPCKSLVITEGPITPSCPKVPDDTGHFACLMRCNLELEVRRVSGADDNSVLSLMRCLDHLIQTSSTRGDEAEDAGRRSKNLAGEFGMGLDTEEID
jgi:hypothetical protein